MSTWQLQSRLRSVGSACYCWVALFVFAFITLLCFYHGWVGYIVTYINLSKVCLLFTCLTLLPRRLWAYKVIDTDLYHSAVWLPACLARSAPCSFTRLLPSFIENRLAAYFLWRAYTTRRGTAQALSKMAVISSGSHLMAKRWRRRRLV